nr:MAG: ORF1 [Torque teno midi virus]
MPFYWRRRKRWWWGKRWNRYKRKPRYKRRRRPYKRRRTRRTYRRRPRRRRYKVKKKKKAIVLKQWQPDSIRKCKIKGYGVLVLGAQGRQFLCYTNMIKYNWIPKAPGGGGFGCQLFSLGSLYTDYVFKKNIWTHTNIYYDLVRYLGVRFTFYRHPETDFIISYDNQPPFDIQKYTYMYCHPANMLLARHKKILLSAATNPRGKLKLRIRIRPPKQMITKWFFSSHFSAAGLCLIKAAAMQTRYANMGCCNTNQLLTVYYLDPVFYANGNWAHKISDTTPYLPYNGIPLHLWYWTTKDDINANIPQQLQDKQKWTKPTTYDESVSWDKGCFCKQLMTAIQVSTSYSPVQKIAALPVNVARYNLNYDTGEKSELWLCSAFTKGHEKPTTDHDLYMSGYPIWMMLWGFLNYVQMKKQDKTYFDTYYIVLKSPAFFPKPAIGAGDYYIPIDYEFVQGTLPYEEYVTKAMKAAWYPKLKNQMKILNIIATSGPFVPKYDETKNSTWELDYFYQFFFKFGGPELTDPKVVDPQYQSTYDVPDKYTGTIQITDPAKNKASKLFHAWDWRRGLLTKRAFEAMQQNLSTDSDVSTDSSSPQKKKKRTGPLLNNPEDQTKEIKKCLLSLCEEPTCQEPQEEEDLKYLIKQQQQQQLELKRNLLKLLMELKEKQRMLQLQTGVLE